MKTRTRPLPLPGMVEKGFTVDMRERQPEASEGVQTEYGQQIVQAMREGLGWGGGHEEQDQKRKEWLKRGDQKR